MCKVERMGRQSGSAGSWRLVPRQLMTVVMLVAIAGCAPVNRDELVKQILKVDPEFGAVLEKHRELTNRVETFKRELALKRTHIERSMQQLRRELATATANVQAKTADAKKRMEPDHKRLEQALASTSSELQAKRQQRAALSRELAQKRKSSEPSASSSSDDSQRHELLRDVERLDAEMTALKEHARLLKIKLLLIKL